MWDYLGLFCIVTVGTSSKIAMSLIFNFYLWNVTFLKSTLNCINTIVSDWPIRRKLSYIGDTRVVLKPGAITWLTTNQIVEFWSSRISPTRQKQRKKVKNTITTRNECLNLSRSINKKCREGNFTYKTFLTLTPN